MRLLTRLLLFSSIAVGWVTSEQIQDTSSADSSLITHQSLESETEIESEHHVHHPPQYVDPWAKRYLTAIASAGDLSSYIVDDSTTDFVFPARFKKAHENKNLCHGALRVDPRPDEDGPTRSKPKPTVFPRSFYGWDQEYCEWLTAVSYAKMKPEERQQYVKDPTVFFYRVPEACDDNLFLYTESRETFQTTIAKNLEQLPPRRKAAWMTKSKGWSNKPQAVKLVNDVCEMMGRQSLWPKKFIGTINRVPFSSGLLVAMGEMGAQLEVADDNDPVLTSNNRLQKVAQFFERYANEEAQAKMQPWLWALGNGTRADEWVSNYQLEVTLCNAPDNSVGSTKLKSYQLADGDIEKIYPPTCANIWNKKHDGVKEEPVILDYGAAMQIGPYCGKSGKEWCRPALFGITTAQFPAVMTRIRQDNMRRLFSLKRRGRGPVTAEYNALIDRLIQITVQPDWMTDVMVTELRTIAKTLLEILDPKPTTAPPTTIPPTQAPNNCCCCMGCQTCCGNPIAKLKAKVVEEASVARTQYDVDSDADIQE